MGAGPLIHNQKSSGRIVDAARSHQQDKSLRILLSCAQMAKADQAAIRLGTSGLNLMEAAGRCVAEEALAHMKDGQMKGGRALVLAGPGNNGGDGWVAARALLAAGMDVKVLSLVDPQELRGDAAAMAALYKGAWAVFDPNLVDSDILGAYDLIIDALFGAGLSRPVDGAAADLIAAANRSRAYHVAVDVPSGLSGDSGQPLGLVFDADLTVSFFRKKPGHLLMPGRQKCGQLVVRQIGIPDSVLDAIQPMVYENHPALWADHWPQLAPDGHKYQRGHALVMSGGPPFTGAARLTASAALRAGAGAVTLITPKESYPIQAASLMEVMVAPFKDRAGYRAFMDDPRRTVLALGPGLGLHPDTRQKVADALATAKPCVLDADGLSSFADDPEALFAMIGSRAEEVVMTPHGGEFARLFGPTPAPDSADSDGAIESKLKRSLEAAQKSGAVIVHKGADSVIAAPDGRVVINANAPPWLATAGSGDVLAGFIAGLMAQGMPAFEAACSAVWLHGAAALPAGRGMIAGDLIAALPKVMRDLDAQFPRPGGPRS
ncbi:bifunctional NAD(P)H-hydrate repair enzyme [Iodidimonas nitroreducens]|uniref:Bifunctional NAD(P)H-hydrate repair enzyme n=1 Tax=Iodidimonas nitroreducens TaxID=1236968 RepID=A0A5A7N7X9_9PROT|nr:bifunctional NAD(P)H-hydrate repair enzyme [Iodidimonas nitroreducens]